MRAYFYQRETRAVLVGHGWRISRDENGKLVASHTIDVLGAGPSGKLELTYGPVPASPLHAVAWLTLTFRPESLQRTKCAGNVVGYTFWDGMIPLDKSQLKPFPFDNPETKLAIQQIMGEAEHALEIKHSEYNSR